MAKLRLGLLRRWQRLRQTLLMVPRGGYWGAEQEAAGGQDQDVGRAINYKEMSGSPITRQTAARRMQPYRLAILVLGVIEWFA